MSVLKVALFWSYVRRYFYNHFNTIYTSIKYFILVCRSMDTVMQLISYLMKGQM